MSDFLWGIVKTEKLLCAIILLSFSIGMLVGVLLTLL